MSMFNAHIVFLTADHDCDGVSYAAHRVSVPAHRALEFIAGDSDALADFMVSGDLKYYAYARDAYDIMTEADFLRQFGPNLGAWERDYWTTEGYSNRHIAPAWEPWVEDDTIGIPALDTRYESEVW